MALCARQKAILDAFCQLVTLVKIKFFQGSNYRGLLMKKMFLVLALLASNTVFCIADTISDAIKNEEGKKLLKESSLVALEAGASAGLVAAVVSVLNDKKLNLALIGECALSSALFAAAYYSAVKTWLNRPTKKVREDAAIAGVLFGGLVLRVHYLP